MAPKITVKDIARQASVSPGTVSRVLNNRTNVKEETRQRILATIKELNYDPFQNLPLINNVKTKAIGLIVPSVAYDGYHPFNQRAVMALQTEASRREYTTILLNEDEIIKKTQAQYHHGSKNIPCDALVVFCPHRNWDTYLAVLRSWGFPCVLIRRNTRVAGVSTISDDDLIGGRLVLDHLYGLGHRSIGYLGTNIALGKATGRPGSYYAFHRERGLPLHDGLLYDSNAGKDRLRTWVTERIAAGMTAVMCSDDTLALELIREAGRAGIRVPADLSVTGYDDDHIAEWSNPPLTTLRVPVEQMTRMAMEVLEEVLQGRDAGRVHTELENQLVVRESTAAPRINI